MTPHRALRKRARFLATASLLAIGIAATGKPARAQNATWLATPGTNDFDTAANWTPATVPTGTAFFGTSNTTSLTFSSTTTAIGGWTFNTGASAYTFTNGQTLELTGAGIVINGGSATITNNNDLVFSGTSTAGSAGITNTGSMAFFNGSTAGSAAITNNNNLLFSGTSTAGSASITTNSGGQSFIEGSASGGTARFILNGTGVLDLSGLTTGGTTAGSIEGAGSVFLGSNNLAVGGNNLSTTFSGVIQDGGGFGGTGGSLTKTGTGTLTLSGANTYSGGTTVNAGTLAVSSDANLGAASGRLTFNGGTLQWGASFFSNRSITLNAGGGTFDTQANIGTLYGGISGSGGLTEVGNGTLVLGGNNTYSGATNLNSGALVAGRPGAFSSASAFNIAVGAALDLGGSNETIGSLSGVGTVTSSASIGLATLSIGADNTSTTFSGTINDGAGGISLTKIGAGTLTLTGTNSYSGGTTVNAGTLAVSSDANLGAASGGLTFNGGTLQWGAGFGSSRSITLNAGGGTFDTQANTGSLWGDISGGGGLTKLGNGTLQLGGNNIYFGPTNVTSGVLQALGGGAFSSASAFTVAAGATLDLNGFNETIGSLSGAGTVTNGALIFLPATLTTGADNTSTTFSGTINNGPGGLGLTKIGAGTLTLTGTNTYSGGTNLNVGTIQVQANNALGAGAMAMANGTTLQSGAVGLNVGNVIALTGTDTVDTNGNTMTLSGVISGTGTLTKAGVGALVLTNNGNRYSGGTNLNVGTIQVQANNALGTGTLLMANGTRLESGTAGLNVGNAITLGAGTETVDTIFGGMFTLSGVISGGGGLTKLDVGTLELRGSNTYAGATNVNGGVLQATSTGGFSSASAFTVRAGATLDLNGWNETIGSLSGAGNVTNSNINLATLTTGADNTSTTFSGTISDGAGGLALSKIGTGTLTLTGTNTYSGATTINGGTLEVDGSIANSSSVTVNSGATLSGTGIVDPARTTIMSGGTLAPGNAAIPTGTLTITGNLAFQSGALYLVQVTPSAAASTNVTGTATLGGAIVNANFASGSYVAKQYTILTAGSVSGTFGASVNTNLPTGFHSSLSYDPTRAYLDLALNFTPPPPGPNFGGGLSINQQNIANTLTNFFNATGGIPMVFGALSPGGLSQAAGETATGSQQTTFNAMTQFMGVMTDPFIGGRGDGITAGSSATPFAEEIDAANAYAAQDPARSKSVRDAYAAIYRKAPAMAAPFDPRWSVWAAGFGGSQTTNGNTALGSNSTTSSIAGTAVGADYVFSPRTIAGFALAGGGTGFSVANGGSGHSDLFQAGAFIRHTVGQAYITGALAYGWQDITTNRTVSVAGIDQLRAEFNANAFSGRLEGGYRFVSPWAGGIGLTPYAAAQFTTFDLPAYAEKATVGSNAFALAYNADDVTDARSEIGIRTDKSWAMPGAVLTLRSRFAWAHDVNPDRSIAATFQTLPGASFTVNGAAQAHDSALTTASVEMKWINGWSATATFEGEFSNVTGSYAGKGVVRYAW